MKKKIIVMILLIMLLSIMVFCVSCKKEEQIVEDPNTIYVMSFNIRQDAFIDTGVKDWDYRASYVVNHIKDKNPHLICFQEVKKSQINDLQESLSDVYNFIYYDRGDGEGLALAYNKDYTLQEQGMYWLSETPDVQSKGFGANYYRICVYMVVEKTSTSEKFLVSNVHLDHIVPKARINGIKLVLERMEKYEMAKIVCGDFNCNDTDTCYMEIANKMQDSQKVAKSTEEGYTYHEWGNPKQKKAIDFCFVSSDYEVNNFEIFNEHAVNDEQKEVYYSDHYAIMSKILKK